MKPGDAFLLNRGTTLLVMLYLPGPSELTCYSSKRRLFDLSQAVALFCAPREGTTSYDPGPILATCYGCYCTCNWWLASCSISWNLWPPEGLCWGMDWTFRWLFMFRMSSITFDGSFGTNPRPFCGYQSYAPGPGELAFPRLPSLNRS
jgi:hypothetical protein